MEKIRILHVVTYMGRGGLENMIMNYYRHVDRDKVQFDFLVHREFRADFDDEIESLGGRIYRLPEMKPWSPAYKIALDSFFAEHKEYKIVHSHRNSFSSIVLKSAKKNGVPMRIAHSHSSGEKEFLKHIIKRHYGKMIPKYATELFACGKEAGEWMFRGASFRIINNAIDSNRFSYKKDIANNIRNLFNIPVDAFVIGHVGNFSHPKNITFLVDVFNEINRKSDNSYLLLVGDGGLRNSIEQKVEFLGLKTKVIFAGLRSDVYDMMQAMDAFVFPSLHEGLPVVMVEAQASGLPCFISDGVPDESMITDLVTKIPLSHGAEKWADTILNNISKERGNTKEQIVKAGYDITENAKWLQNYYLNKWNEEV